MIRPQDGGQLPADAAGRYVTRADGRRASGDRERWRCALRRGRHAVRCLAGAGKDNDVVTTDDDT
jgi:hypothetical protein